MTVEPFRAALPRESQSQLSEAAAAVAVTRLSLTDFRNYGALRLDLAPAPVALIGANGAGKTNLLEAVSLLAPGRGLRRARLSDLIRRDSGGTEVPGRAWAVAAHVRTTLGETEVGTGLVPSVAPEGRDAPLARVPRDAAFEPDTDEDQIAPERRVVRIDGRTRGPAALAGVLSVRWLTPAMDRLFVEGASTRRRFLDHLASGLDSGHAPRVAAYERALRERARLLRDGQGGRTPDRHWLAALEGTLAELGVAIAAARNEYVARLTAQIAAEAVIGLHLVVDGTVEESLRSQPALSAETKFREALAASREHDALTGGAAVGPHRSDLGVWHGSGLPASQCSTGEQKSLLLAIVRADVRLLAAAEGRPPLLLLDEVAAHLDERRRTELFDAVLACGAQVWTTGTDRALFHALEGRAQFLQATHGQLVAV
ncbi:MAG: DNA replication/repair protein RecF [Alphaproteobacteria bacterium]|nr:DNA replication/repair protein RecF [Alphaproteobacteria bacterium]